MSCPHEARRLLAAFLDPACPQRLFRHPAPHPATPTGFCFCDRGLFATLALVLRGAAWQAAEALPSSALIGALLRLGGLRAHPGAFFSAGCWFDPVFPGLITVEEGVFVGMGARIYAHEFRPDEFRAGRTVLRRGAFLGGHCLIGAGVEVGAGAVVAAGAVVGRDVPPGMLAIGNPARIVPRVRP